MKFVLAVIAAQLAGGLVTQMSPLVVGGVIIGLELTEQQAGFVAFAEFMVLAITAIVIAPFLPKLSCRRLCLVAAAAAVSAQLLSITTNELALLVAMRCIAGAGAGLVYAASLAAVASRSTNPDKLYGYIQVTWAVLSTILFSLGGYLTDLYAHRGIYGMIAGLTLALMLCFRWLPSAGHAVAATIQTDQPAAPSWLGLATLAGIFIHLTASAAVYTFTAPLGERAGLSTSQVGYALTAGAVVGFTGAGLATWLNVRKGRALPIAAFLAAFSIIALVLCTNTHPVVFVVALVLSVLFFYFSVPYLFGLAAALDQQGRWAAAAGSAYLLGFAVGPAFAGAMIEWYDYLGLGIAAVIAATLACVLLLVVVRNLGYAACHP